MKVLDIDLPEPLAGAVRACGRHLGGVAVFSALLNILYLAPAIYMMQVYDRVVPTGGLLTLFFITLVVLAALATLAALDAIRGRLLVRAGLRLDRLVAGPLLDRLTAGGKAPSLQAMRDFDVLRQALAGPAMLGLLDVPWTPIYVIIAFLLHPALGTLTVVGGAILVFLALLNERSTRAKLQEAAKANAAAYIAQDAITRHAEVVRALGMRTALRERQVAERQEGLNLSGQAQFAGGQYSAATKFMRLFLQSAALGLGAWLAVERQISAGAIIAASILMSRALQPVEQVVGSWSAVVQARSAMKSLATLFAETPAAADRTKLPDPVGKLQFERVVVRAPGSDALLLKGVTFAVNPGEILGVAGASGAGKTTLARVAAGAAVPDMGAVRIDGASYTDWDSDRLGRHIGYLPQDISLLAGTVRDNISRFDSWTGEGAEAVDAAVVEAAQAAGVHDLILRLPQGYDTILGPGGRGVSAGQGQRIGLARALYRNPALLVLDEPNAALDADGEAALARALTTARARGAAILIVAHRSGILQSADNLLILKDGAVEQFGPRAEVLSRLGSARKAPAAANVVELKGQP